MTSRFCWMVVGVQLLVCGLFLLERVGASTRSSKSHQTISLGAYLCVRWLAALFYIHFMKNTILVKYFLYDCVWYQYVD